MWAELARYVKVPMGAYPGHYSIMVRVNIGVGTGWSGGAPPLLEGNGKVWHIFLSPFLHLAPPLKICSYTYSCGYHLGCNIRTYYIIGVCINFNFSEEAPRFYQTCLILSMATYVNIM